MARSKSKHIRMIMRRRKQHKQRMKRRAADAKAVPKTTKKAGSKASKADAPPASA